MHTYMYIHVYKQSLCIHVQYLVEVGADEEEVVVVVVLVDEEAPAVLRADELAAQGLGKGAVFGVPCGVEGPGLGVAVCVYVCVR